MGHTLHPIPQLYALDNVDFGIWAFGDTTMGLDAMMEKIYLENPALLTMGVCPTTTRIIQQFNVDISACNQLVMTPFFRMTVG